MLRAAALPGGNRSASKLRKAGGIRDLVTANMGAFR